MITVEMGLQLLPIVEMGGTVVAGITMLLAVLVDLVL